MRNFIVGVFVLLFAPYSVSKTVLFDSFELPSSSFQLAQMKKEKSKEEMLKEKELKEASPKKETSPTKEKPPVAKETPPPIPAPETRPVAMCGDPKLVINVHKTEGKKYDGTWYVPMSSFRNAKKRVKGSDNDYVVDFPSMESQDAEYTQYVGKRGVVKFSATVKDKTLVEQFKWVQYIKGYIWSGTIEGGRYVYKGNNSSAGKIVNANGLKKISKKTNLNDTIPKVNSVKQKPSDSVWTFDDKRSVGFYTTTIEGNNVKMEDVPGITQLIINKKGTTFFDMNLKFRAYLVCPLAPKLAYGRCVWNTQLTMNSFTFLRTADTPVCTTFKVPKNLLKGDDPLLKITPNTPRTQDYFKLPGGL
jgi:hypothetical protein